MRVHVGTSGYNYPEWKGTFYPADLKTREMFGYYSTRFRTVEINYTFYRMPAPTTTTAWREQAPPGFTYALKAPRRITHDKRLVDCGELVQRLTDTAQLLGSHLGPLLFQLPPSARCDLPRLETFLALMPQGVRTAFEFRHESWLNDAVFAALERHSAALCIADFGDRTTPVKATTRHGYLRLRDEGYGPDDLRRWADRVAALDQSCDDVFVYFKHEEEGKGPAFAAAFVESLAQAGVTAS